MKPIILFLIILSLFTSTNSYSNILENVRKELVEKVLLYLPSKNNIDILKMYITLSNTKEEYSLRDEESVFLIFKWITQNIIYDCYLNKLDNNETPTDVYKSGKGTSKGISDLFKAMCNYMGIESDSISGLIKKSVRDVELLKIIDYNWNYIKINSTYYLIDISSSIGACDGDEFLEHYSEFYFAPDPEIFIRHHFPEENKWQLLDKNITKDQFISMAFTTEWYYLFGFKTINPDSNNITGLEETKFTLTFESNKTKPKVIGITGNSDFDFKEINYTNYIFSEGKIEVSFDLTNEEITYFWVVIEQYVPSEKRNNLTGVVMYKIIHLKKKNENELLKYSKNNNNLYLKELLFNRFDIK